MARIRETREANKPYLRLKEPSPQLTNPIHRHPLLVNLPLNSTLSINLAIQIKPQIIQPLPSTLCPNITFTYHTPRTTGDKYEVAIQTDNLQRAEDKQKIPTMLPCQSSNRQRPKQSEKDETNESQSFSLGNRELRREVSRKETQESIIYRIEESQVMPHEPMILYRSNSKSRAMSINPPNHSENQDNQISPRNHKHQDPIHPQISHRNSQRDRRLNNSCDAGRMESVLKRDVMYPERGRKKSARGIKITNDFSQLLLF